MFGEITYVSDFRSGPSGPSEITYVFGEIAYVPDFRSGPSESGGTRLC